MRTYRYTPLYYSYWSLYNYLDSNYCRTRCRQSQLRFVLSPLLLHLRLLGMFQSDIPLFTLTWPAKHSPNQGWESTHRLHLYPLGGVFYSPKHRALGRRDLDFTSHPKDWLIAVSNPTTHTIINPQMLFLLFYIGMIKPVLLCNAFMVWSVVFCLLNKHLWILNLVLLSRG